MFRARVLVASSCAGMGLDVPNVSLVVNTQAPRSDWVAQQQMGRAGRDGRQTVCVNMAPKFRMIHPSGWSILGD